MKYFSDWRKSIRRTYAGSVSCWITTRFCPYNCNSVIFPVETLTSIYHFTVVREDLLQLHGIFGSVLESALDIVDKGQVKVYCSHDKREVIEIKDQQEVHIFYANINYCPCRTFRERVLQFGQQYTCKHVLAARLAKLIGKTSEDLMSDDTFNNLTQIISEQ